MRRVVKDKILNGYKNLSLAIVEQAANDYKAIKKEMYSAKENKLQIEEVMDFFNSEWFEFLCDVDREVFIKKLEKVC